ncbi:hypothetical protein SAMN04488107_1443 [Geodermatophilus saharensis]|uniref:GNAT family N-acetyltransferase n=1 Tax=Geodermatophilus saharensis TaxID=1137994 RepID=A0A239BUL3_9ACTN|nr:hypothetical protein [Geodermatophilus saharensis]SNS11616.1 hypothetical protein SAMN04488107_1443 [Geodermatophilus saharensis]
MDDVRSPLPVGHATADARSTAWQVVHGQGSVAARSADGGVAEAVLRDDEDAVRVEVRASRPLPARTAAALVTELFSEPAFRRARPVLLALPAAHHEVVTEVRRRLVEVDAHVAGATCLLSGRMG